jgi:hypothetical protein
MASQGPNDGSTFVTDNTVGTVIWNNPSRAQTQDDANVSNALNLPISTGTSEYLKATGFGFGIPGFATITGVRVEADAWGAGSVGVVVDNQIRLVKGGAISGSNLASGGFSVNTDSDVYKSWGGDGEMWGNTLTPADVNAATFGCALSFTNTDAGATRTVQCDHLRMTVFYSSPASALDGQGVAIYLVSSLV